MLGKLLIAGSLFIFAVFLIADLETSIGTIGAETLQPVLALVPVLIIGSVFIAIFYAVFRNE